MEERIIAIDGANGNINKKVGNVLTNNMSYIKESFRNHDYTAFQVTQQDYTAIEEIYCTYCGTENRADAKFCRKCGRPIS